MEDIKELATIRVGMMADPSLEHARLACSLGFSTPASTASAFPLAPAAPTAAGGAVQPGGGGGESELSSREKRIVEKAIAAVLNKSSGGQLGRG